MGIDTSIKWTSNTIYVDIDTGERISKHEAQQRYFIIKKTKYGTTNFNKTRGHIEYTNECKRKNQGELNFG